MKQVIFAIALLAMASLTGCLDTDDTSVDENTDTTSDNTGNTNQDGTIDPVGTDGVTIPEDSSIFIDSMGSSSMGSYECNIPNNGTVDYHDDSNELICDYNYYEKDFFRNNYDSSDPTNPRLKSITYIDVDGIQNGMNFNGWVNKTGQTVTIEQLIYPDRGYFYNGIVQIDIDDDGTIDQVPKLIKQTNQPVSENVCYNGHSKCNIIFFGVNNLLYNAEFSFGGAITTTYTFAADTDDDGQKDTIKEERYHKPHTITFDLPFEPYGFEFSSEGYNYNPTIYRIF